MSNINQLIDDAAGAFSDDDSVSTSEEDAPRAAEPKKRGRPPGRKDSKPRKGTTTRKTKEQTSSATTDRKAARAEAAANAYADLAASGDIAAQIAEAWSFPVMMFAAMDQVCGQALLESMPNITKALDAWAKTSPAVAKALKGSLTSSGPLLLISALAPVFRVAYMHHGPMKHIFYPPQPAPEEHEPEQPHPFTI